MCIIKSGTKLRKLKPNLELFKHNLKVHLIINNLLFPLGVPSYRTLQGNEVLFVTLGRAVRYNLCCASLHKGFPLPSLTQKKCVFITIIIIAFILFLLFSRLVSLSFGEGWGEDKKISLVFSDKAY